MKRLVAGGGAKLCRLAGLVWLNHPVREKEEEEEE